jgi:hypothetical protein
VLLIQLLFRRAPFALPEIEVNRDRSILSTVGASGKPGAVQLADCCAMNSRGERMRKPE